MHKVQDRTVLETPSTLVAEDYPAVTDTNKVTWYRPVREKGFDVSQWGWTSDPAQADPSYGACLTGYPPNEHCCCDCPPKDAQ